MEATGLVGREDEIEQLDYIVANTKADLVAVYGRRRVGKTYLIKTYLAPYIQFFFSGSHHVETAVQIANFTQELSIQLNNKIPLPIQADWFQVFDTLITLLKKKRTKKKKIIFLDEFPWIQTPKSNFMPAFEKFWNTWASMQSDVAVILCGSAASWMIQHVVRNKGGLHNRLTQKIPLLPFTLYETDQFLKSKGIRLNHFQTLQIYMAFGGIPQYLEQVKPGMSATQIIDNSCFSKNGFLVNEFNDLYRALFDNADKYMKIIRALAKKPMGLTRAEILKTCKLPAGGGATAILEELSTSGFITAYAPFGKKTKESIFKLTDEYSLFYLKFIEPQKSMGKGAWLKISETPSWKSWSGFAFETVCSKHIPAIKKALKIEGIYSEDSSWRCMAEDSNQGSQIDLIIDRRDKSINIFEMKYYNAPFTIDKKYALALQQKMQNFKQKTGTRKQLFLTMITCFGIAKNEHSIGLVENEIRLEDLFAKTR